MPSLSQSQRQRARAIYSKALLGNEPVWRYGMNALSTIEFRKNRPELNAEAQRVLSDLNRDGVAMSTLEALTGDPTLLGRLQAEAAKLEEAKAEVRKAQEAALAESDLLRKGLEKVFVVTMLDANRPEIDPSDVLVETLLHSQVKGIADSYYGLKTKVADINIWRNLPTGRDAVASQLWHRDLPEDHMILKSFIYLEDVTPESGPFHYIKGTHGKGNRTWRPEAAEHDGDNYRVGLDEMAAVTSDTERVSFPAPAGTILFGDTFGWHKGGEAKTDTRFVVQALFSSPAALPDRMLAAPKTLKLADAPSELRYDKKTFTN